MIHNLFIVKSPIQIINSIEAVNNFNLKHNILVILNDGSSKNSNQMEKIIKWISWDKIIRIEDSGKTKIFQYVKLIYNLKKYKFNHMFFGEFGSIHKALLANLDKEIVYYLDDGIGTYTDYKISIESNKPNKYNFKEIRFAFFNLKVKIKDTINLFTYYDDIKSSKRLIIKNKLNYLKSTKLKELNQTEDIIILGQPIENLINDDVYVNFIKSIKFKYKNKKIIYMPHRGEDKNQIDSIKKLEDTFFEFRENDIPIELYFLEYKILPNTVLSFCSTALTTLELIYNIPNILSVEIPKNLTNNINNYNLHLVGYYKKLKDKNLLKFEDLEYIDNN